MNGIPEHLEYPDRTMSAQVEHVAQQYPDYIAYDFMGRHTT